MPKVRTLVAAPGKFIRDEVLPIDDEYDGDVEAAGGDDLRVSLQATARQVGIFVLHGPVDCGRLGLSMTKRTPMFEAAGHSAVKALTAQQAGRAA